MMDHQLSSDDEVTADHPAKKRAMDDERSATFYNLLICEKYLKVEEGINYLLKFSKRYLSNNEKEMCPIGIFSLNNVEDFKLLSSHFLNGNVDVIYGSLIIAPKIIQLYVLDKTQSVLVNFKIPAALTRIENDDKITLGDYNGRFKIYSNSGKRVCEISPPTPCKINALEKSIRELSNVPENEIEDFHDALTQHDIDKSSTSNNISNLETQINNDIFQSPIIPSKRQLDTSRSKKIKLFNYTYSDMHANESPTEDSQNLLIDRKTPSKSFFKISKHSASNQWSCNTRPLFEKPSNSFYNGDNINREKPKSVFSKATNTMNKPYNNIEKDIVNALYSNRNTTILEKYADKYGNNSSNVDIYDIPTQIIAKDTSQKENPFDVPTQIIVPNKKDSFIKTHLTTRSEKLIPQKLSCAKPEVSLHKSNSNTIDNGSEYDVPTQIIDLKKTVESFNNSDMITQSKRSITDVSLHKPNSKTIDNDNEYDVPTQIIDPKKNVESFNNPDNTTQRKHAKPYVSLHKLNSNTIDNDSKYDVPTQIIDLKKTVDSFNNPTMTTRRKRSNTDVSLHKPNSKTIDNGNEYDVPTQIIDPKKNVESFNNPDTTTQRKHAKPYVSLHKLDSNTIDNDSEYDVPTQIIDPKKNVESFNNPDNTTQRKHAKPYVSLHKLNSNTTDNDSEYDVPTQIIDLKKTVDSFNNPTMTTRSKRSNTDVSLHKPNSKTIDNGNEYDVPTQIIDPKKKVESFNNPDTTTQRKHTKPYVSLHKSNSKMIDNSNKYDVPTQIIDPKKNVESFNNSEMTTRRKRSKIDISLHEPNSKTIDNNNEYDVPTQIIDPKKIVESFNNPDTTARRKHSKIDVSIHEPNSKTIDNGSEYDVPTQIIDPKKIVESFNKPHMTTRRTGSKTDISLHKPVTNRVDIGFYEIPIQIICEKLPISSEADPFIAPDIDFALNNVVKLFENDLTHETSDTNNLCTENLEVDSNVSFQVNEKIDEKKNYYESTQQVVNDLLSQIPTNLNNLETTKKNISHINESPKINSSPESPEDTYGFREVTTPILKQNYISSKDVVLSPVKDERESSPEELKPIAHRRKFPNKKLKTTTEKKKKLGSPSRTFNTHIDEKSEIPDSLQNSLNTRKRRSINIKPVFRIMLSRFEPKDLPKYEKIVIELGGILSTDNWNILVSPHFSRSFKSLQSVSLGIPLVSKDWLTDSYKSGRILDSSKYIFKNENYQYSSTPSNFLKDYTVYTPPNISSKMLEHLNALIKLNGGTHIEIKPGQEIEFKFWTQSEKVFTIFDINNTALEIEMPKPYIEVVDFCTMVFKRELNFKKAQNDKLKFTTSMGGDLKTLNMVM